MSLRLQSEVARDIFDTKWLPVISHQDPIKFKLLRKAHELGVGTTRRTHNLEKASRANLICGEVGLTWHRQRYDCKNFISTCGICLRYKKIKARPPLKPSLCCVNLSIRPFEHTSVDPLGHIRVTTCGVNSQKVYPLICVDIDNGATHFEIMQRMESKDLYLALCRLQY